MKKLISFFLPLICLLICIEDLRANRDSHQITIVALFDYPGAGSITAAYGINNVGDVAGYFDAPDGSRRGFIRLQNGTTSAPIVEPNDTEGITVAYGINRSREVDGYFVGGSQDGFFLRGRHYSEYQFPDSSSTGLFALNDAADFAGYYDGGQAFVSIGGVATDIDVPENTSGISVANGMNNVNQVVGTYYVYDNFMFIPHGFLSNPDGSIVAPIDFPRAISTNLQGISDRGLMVGYYLGFDEVTHAFIFKLPATFISYDVPGAFATEFNDINSQGEISGFYTDIMGFSHGLIARLQ